MEAVEGTARDVGREKTDVVVVVVVVVVRTKYML